MPRTFGHCPGVEVGESFPDRRTVSQTGVHRPLQAGISGSGSEGADSIVLSGGYEDDHDLGEFDLSEVATISIEGVQERCPNPAGTIVAVNRIGVGEVVGAITSLSSRRTFAHQPNPPATVG